MINVIPENYVTEISGIAFLFLSYFDGWLPQVTYKMSQIL